MKTIFGVGSATPINKKLKNGYTMYDWVKRQKCYPAFCMRTLCGEDKITAEEIEFLKAKDCKIGLVIRDLTETKVSAVNGTKEALKAVEAAKELGVAENEGIALFAEIKPEWSVNHNWMISFAQTVSANGYVPGFIGNTDSSKNFNFDRQCSHYVQATKDVNYYNAIFMATEPKRDRMPEEWAPYCPSALEPEDMHLWSCGTTTFDFHQVEDVYAMDDKVLEKMW
ncbi:MAG: hypothetical protein E7574_01115 [Ruminococcaceae bacterium]|nr:hypothetical protein [Oscillospiraceae bacterium]